MGGTINVNVLETLRSSQPFDFRGALNALRARANVRRTHWKEIKFIYLQTPDDFSKMKKTYIVAVGEDSNPYPYALTTADILADDWVLEE